MASYSSKSLSDKGRQKEPSSSSESAEEKVSINLTDPDDVLEKLATLQLDDDDTEELLKRAYEVNQELKKQLQLGRLLMDQRMSSFSANSVDRLKHQKPVSNRISASTTTENSLSREPTRMASATHKAHGRRSQSIGLSSLSNSDKVKSYSYHSYVS